MSNRDRPAAQLRTVHRHHHALLFGLITLLGFALRIALLDAHPFREDEAIYGYWALHTWPDDPLFLTVWPDKPPLFIWILAVVFRLFGAGVASARWLNIAVSTLTIPVVAATAGTLWARYPWRHRAALLAALAMALNPFAISFAPTAFTDPLLVLFGSFALLLTLRRRPFWAGLFLGAAIMTKQQGVLYAPLIAGLWIIERGTENGGRQADDAVDGGFRPRVQLPAFLRLLLGVALITLPIIYWDSLRWAVAPSPWDLSARNYGGLMLVSPAQWLDRLLAWGALAWELTGSWLVWAGLALLWGYSLATKAFQKWSGEAPVARNDLLHSRNAERTTWTLWRWILLWAVGYFVFHIMTNIQIWDRYLLPLTPVFALFVGWTLAMTLIDLSPRMRVMALTLSVFILLVPAWSAAQGRTPIGGDHGAYDGLHEALAWIETEAPDEAILYHRELGWHYQFYFFDQVQDGRYQLRWFPNTVTLADNAAKTPHPRKFYIESNWAPLRDSMQHMALRGIKLVERAHIEQMTVYEVQIETTDFCNWCFSGE